MHTDLGLDVLERPRRRLPPAMSSRWVGVAGILIAYRHRRLLRSGAAGDATRSTDCAEEGVICASHIVRQYVNLL